MGQYNWEEIRARYETGRYTMKELAQEYGFNENYGHRKSSNQGWEKGKSKEKVRKTATKKIQEEEAEKQKAERQEMKEEYLKIYKNLRRKIANQTFSDPDFEQLKICKIASEALENCKNVEFILYGIETGKGDINIYNNPNIDDNELEISVIESRDANDLLENAQETG